MNSHSDVDEHWTSVLRSRRYALERAEKDLNWEVWQARAAGVTWRKINEAIGGSAAANTQRKYTKLDREYAHD